MDSLASGVSLYHTLASVACAPHPALASVSSASVVAPVVSTESANGSGRMTVAAPAKVSLLGAAASAGVANARLAPATRLTRIARCFKARPPTVLLGPLNPEVSSLGARRRSLAAASPGAGQ